MHSVSPFLYGLLGATSVAPLAPSPSACVLLHVVSMRDSDPPCPTVDPPAASPGSMLAVAPFVHTAGVAVCVTVVSGVVPCPFVDSCPCPGVSGDTTCPVYAPSCSVAACAVVGCVAPAGWVGPHLCAYYLTRIAINAGPPHTSDIRPIIQLCIVVCRLSLP